MVQVLCFTFEKPENFVKMEKMLVIRILSFSHSIFKGRSPQGFGNSQFILLSAKFIYSVLKGQI